jgi:hypothetical protein
VFAKTFPEVKTKFEETHVFCPMHKRFDGTEFPIPTLDVVMNPVEGLVN